MGRWITAARRHRRSRAAAPSLAAGALAVVGGVAIAATLAAIAEARIERAPRRTRDLLRGLALKPALSLWPLIAAAQEVQHALELGDLIEARRALGWHLVSRDTRRLSASEVAGAAIESVAENLSDSFVAPLLAFRVGGLAAAYTYRTLNTADAMLGYHSPELEWFGKVAARADDIANIIPARATAVLIGFAASVAGGSSRAAFATAARDARRTASPNAGWPMAAMAGALGVRLTKRGHYRLNDGGREPQPRDIGRSCRIALAAAATAVILADLK
jgi:adenosylcobinamide-phosphate synthase